jgi:hypothetical protein
MQDRLCGIGLLRPDADGYEFKYPLVRTLLRETVSRARLRLLDQLCAQDEPPTLASDQGVLPSQVPANGIRPRSMRVTLSDVQPSPVAAARETGS